MSSDWSLIGPNRQYVDEDLARTSYQPQRRLYEAYYKLDLPLPKFAPAYQNLYVDETRHGWVERYQLPGEAACRNRGLRRLSSSTTCHLTGGSMQRIIGSIGLLAILACGGSGNPSVTAAPDASASTAPNNCAGQRVATVSNDWTAAVEIFARVAGEAKALGILQAGQRADFPLQPGTTEVYPLQEGRDVANAASRNLKQYVNIRYQCR
jgi:hypothetical protein